ncbi:MAG: NRDE family protein [Pseudomonadales bacterium]|nr:NRDE family protein [Pseudomonadales bacterium]MCP5183378.1 NRDE family protein [Pseudomonadales bacterium]
MCLVLFAYRTHPGLPLVVAANRDEFYRRPALAVHRWENDSRVLGGRDLEAGGSWMGVSTGGRFAAVTNFSDPTDNAPLSRGALVADFLQGTMTVDAYMDGIDGPRYRGFNLLLWDGEQLAYTSNRAEARVLAPGIYGLSNTMLGGEWPKVIRGRNALEGALREAPSTSTLIDLLADDSVPPDDQLPDRGRPLDMERRVAPMFIRGDEYGTRASTAVLISDDHVTIAEQLYGPGGMTGSRQEHHLPRERPCN